MAAGPTPSQVSAARRRMVRELAAKVALALGTTDCHYMRGGTARVSDITISTHLMRASNGEAFMYAVAESPRGKLGGVPWGDNPATPERIVSLLA